MKIMRWASVALIAIFASAGIAGPIEDASYSNLFGRAQPLVPGHTVVEQDLKKAGTWETDGGLRRDTAQGFAVEARSNSVEFVWKGALLREGLPHTLKLNVTTPVPVQVQFHPLIGKEFEREGESATVAAGTNRALTFTIKAPGARRYGDPSKYAWHGFKLAFAGKQLASNAVIVEKARLACDYQEGYFRREVAVPAGEIWEAVAEVGARTILYVNGKRVDDETIIQPRPAKRGRDMYASRRVPLKSFMKSGRNVLGIHVTGGGIPIGYLCGSVVMASGERILLDTGTNWVWNREAPENWATEKFDASGWQRVVDAAEIPQSMGQGIYYKGNEGIASRMANIGLGSRPRGDRPCYDGLIKLRHPSDNQLFFNENAPFRLTALIPPGFKDGKPELAWEISRYAEGGTFIPVTSGKATEFKLEGDSLTASMEADKLARGIYVLTGRLSAGGAVVEEREPEPLVVTGKVKMEQAAGDTWEQGLNLELEKTVDFTDPKDPHPWFETDNKAPIPSAKWGTNYYHTVEPALIVEKKGLKYRVTRPVNRAQFSYLVEFAHPGDWYLLALEYPDDAERWIGVSCNADRTPDHLRRSKKPEEGFSACSKCGPTIWTGGKYPNTGKMLEMKWLYRPDPGTHSINVMSLMKNTEAAAARLKIFHVKGRLPELDAGSIAWREQRRFGMVTERTAPWGNGIYDLFSSIENRIGATNAAALDGGRGAGDYSKNAMVDGCEHLRLLEDAASHYAEYMRFAGQNVHAMGCFQYSDDNTAAQYLVGDPRIYNSSKNMLARVLAANDLMFYASVEFMSTTRQSAEQSPDWYFANRQGKRPVSLWASKALNLSFLHPRVEAEMLELARQLADCFKHQPNFLGINWSAYFDGFWLPSYRIYSYPPNPEADPLEYGYDDVTIGLFEKDTGVKVPGGKAGIDAEGQSKPDVCEKRYQFLTSPEMKPRWLAWRSQKMAEFFVKVSRVIRTARPDLETVAGCYLWFTDIREWKHGGLGFQQYLDSWGWNPDAFRDKDGVWLMPWLFCNARYQPAYRAEEYAMAWQANQDPDFYRAFSGLARRAIVLCAGWIEVERIAGNYPYREGWPRPYQQTMMGQQREEMAMEPYTQTLIGMDPQMVIMGFTDQTPYIGVEGMQKKFTRVLRRLPWGRFEPVLETGFNSNFAIRALRAGNEYWFYVANPAYWPVRGTVTLEGADRVTDLVSGKELAMKQGALAVALEPFGVAAFKAEGSGTLKSEIKIAAWQAAPADEKDLAHMRGILAQAQAALARPGNVAGFLGTADYAILTGTVAKAEQALANGRPAAAWAALTDAGFWTRLYQTMPGMPEDILGARQVTVMHIGGGRAPVVDGGLNTDLMWSENAVKTGPFVAENKEFAAARTLVRAGQPGSSLCFAFECDDPEPEKIRGEAGSNNTAAVWNAGDDMVVVTLMPDDKRAYQFAVTAGGAQAARRIAGPAQGDFAPQWQAAVKRHERGWTAELLINPSTAFKGYIRPNTEWKINFHRLFRENQQPPSSWAYTSDWQTTNQMGILRCVSYQP